MSEMDEWKHQKGAAKGIIATVIGTIIATVIGIVKKQLESKPEESGIHIHIGKRKSKK